MSQARQTKKRERENKTGLDVAGFITYLQSESNLARRGAKGTDCAPALTWRDKLDQVATAAHRDGRMVAQRCGASPCARDSVRDQFVLGSDEPRRHSERTCHNGLARARRASMPGNVEYTSDSPWH
mmetsp:Transcript_10770/g.30549  ORF Transcript_10770/g.30549 Transcript_10770/m.30549 type:complete len:126 (+) Transcript_10770:501-878(+)